MSRPRKDVERLQAQVQQYEKALEALGVEVYAPTGSDFSAAHPAHREDSTQPVPEEKRPHLPCTKEILSRDAFLYDAEKDCYYCPMGKALKHIRRGTHHLTGVANQRYKCPGKALFQGCRIPRVAKRNPGLELLNPCGIL